MKKNIGRFAVAALALGASFCLGAYWFWGLGLHVSYVLKNFYDVPGISVSVAGWLIPVNFKPAWPYQYYHVQCREAASGKPEHCLIISGPSSVSGERDLHMSLSIDYATIRSYSNTKIVLSTEFACRREEWVIDRLQQGAWMESSAQPVEKQTGDCSKTGTDVRKSFIGDSSELKKAASASH